MKRLVISAVILAALAGPGIWWFSDTQVLKRRTGSLLATLTLDSGTGRAGRQMAAYSLNALLASQVELENPEIEEANGSFERAELEAAFSWLCNQARQTRFEAGKFHSVSFSGDVAKVQLSLTGLVELPAYRPADGTYEVTFHWQKEEDGWRLSRAVWNQIP